jgi:hypothetical protein
MCCCFCDDPVETQVRLYRIDSSTIRGVTTQISGLTHIRRDGIGTCSASFIYRDFDHDSAPPYSCCFHRFCIAGRGRRGLVGRRHRAMCRCGGIDYVHRCRLQNGRRCRARFKRASSRVRQHQNLAGGSKSAHDEESACSQTGRREHAEPAICARRVDSARREGLAVGDGRGLGADTPTSAGATERPRRKRLDALVMHGFPPLTKEQRAA